MIRFWYDDPDHDADTGVFEINLYHFGIETIVRILLTNACEMS